MNMQMQLVGTQATDCVQAGMVLPAGTWEAGDEPIEGILSDVGPETPCPGRFSPHLQ